MARTSRAPATAPQAPAAAARRAPRRTRPVRSPRTPRIRQAGRGHRRGREQGGPRRGSSSGQGPDRPGRPAGGRAVGCRRTRRPQDCGTSRTSCARQAGPVVRAESPPTRRRRRQKVHDVAGWLESRNPGEIVDELRGIARRRPGAFLLGAVAAGSWPAASPAGRSTPPAPTTTATLDRVRRSRWRRTAYLPPPAGRTSTSPGDLTPRWRPPRVATRRRTDDPLYSGASLGGNR